jgi:hypothetical protein
MPRPGPIFFAVSLFSSSLLAAPRSSPRRVALEADPVPFLNHGYSAHLVTKPDASARFRVGFGFFGYDLATPSGDNAGFDVRVDAFEGNVGVFPLDGVLRGAFVGLYVFVATLPLSPRRRRGRSATALPHRGSRAGVPAHALAERSLHHAVGGAGIASGKER